MKYKCKLLEIVLIGKRDPTDIQDITHMFPIIANFCVLYNRGLPSVSGELFRRDSAEPGFRTTQQLAESSSPT